MALKKKEFVCQKCSARFPKWTGRCGHCGEWDTLEEKDAPTKKQLSLGLESLSPPQILKNVSQKNSEERWQTNVFEFDRVVGGGIVRGSFGLLGGAPGVGKSTLILQLLGRLTKLNQKVLYVSGEESAKQIKQRADRLLIDQDNILILTESCLEIILNYLKEIKPDFVVIDSIQTLYTEELTASAGSVTQVRETASLLIRYAKSTETSVLMIGHITKGGDIAGPKTLEHMVDYVLYLEGEKREQIRILRTVKNRFGSINEVGLFKMTAKGLAEISQPNNLFLEPITASQLGTAVFAAYEGSRTLFLEVQVLVGETQQNHPSRTTMGMDRNRLQLLIAVLEKHLQLNLSQNDIYVNLAGGFKILEPAIDLAVIAALLSSHLKKPLPLKSIYLGEVALTGDFRNINSLEDRLYEAERYGFEQAFIPANSKKPKKTALKINQLQNVGDLLETIH